ncbi:MAG: hypothetical protein HOE53_04015 [Candidatus Magasanikbacteria bacterium]|jgi:lipid-A-disaccharide synthase-like uncharacterized protein|nr:hypothetical protein [Candidatus Magasanikbacteria bacterium]
MIIPKLFGVLGLIIITIAIFAKKETHQDWLFIAGGSGLLVYSISLKDPIFIPLQIIFILASAYELFLISRKRT